MQRKQDWKDITQSLRCSALIPRSSRPRPSRGPEDGRSAWPGSRAGISHSRREICFIRFRPRAIIMKGRMSTEALKKEALEKIKAIIVVVNQDRKKGQDPLNIITSAAGAA